MQEDKGAPEADQDFARFIKQVRTDAKVSQKKLSEGLMCSSQYARVEKGQRSVCKDMRDCLLGRMGISSDLYENLLNIEDYAAWEQQRDILGAVEQKEFQRAQELLVAYEQQKGKGIKNKIKQQFCLVMRAEIMRQQGAEQREIDGCYEKAVRLTVPKVESLCVAQKLLSIQEVNMVLEYEFYHKGADFLEKCKELMVFVENSLYDDLSKAKIYPKIVWYYLREIYSEQGGPLINLREDLEVCSRAIGLLRDTGRAYFLVELLEMRVRIAGDIEKDAKERIPIQDREKLRAEDRESNQECNQGSIKMLDLLKRLYAEYEVPLYMQDCVYLYRQRWVFYVGDVLRIRRKMFGMTQEELCGDDCSVKSLRRTEKMEKNMQHEALGILLRKLGLSREFQKARLASGDREGLALMEAITSCRNNRELERVGTILNKMKEQIVSEIPENRQYIMEAQASLDWMTGKITDEEFVTREEKALGCTLKVKNLYDMDKVYLTEMEMLCIRQVIQMLPEVERKKCIDFMLRIFDAYEKKNALSDCIVMYEFAILGVICELGNLKEYQQSTNLAQKVLRETLKCRRIWGIDGYLYEIVWNENKTMTEVLQQCITLSHFCKQTFYEDFYYEKLYQS